MTKCNRCSTTFDFCCRLPSQTSRKRDWRLRAPRQLPSSRREEFWLIGLTSHNGNVTTFPLPSYLLLFGFRYLSCFWTFPLPGPQLYLLPNRHIFDNSVICRQSLDMPRDQLSPEIPWAEKLFIRFAGAFQSHRPSAKTATAHIIHGALHLASRIDMETDELIRDPRRNPDVDLTDFEVFRGCCENVTTAITNLRGLSRTKEVSFAPLSCFLASGIRGVLFGPVQARYCPPSGAAQMVHLVKMLVDEGKLLHLPRISFLFYFCLLAMLIFLLSKAWVSLLRASGSTRKSSCMPVLMQHFTQEICWNLFLHHNLLAWLPRIFWRDGVFCLSRRPSLGFTLEVAKGPRNPAGILIIFLLELIVGLTWATDWISYIV